MAQNTYKKKIEKKQKASLKFNFITDRKFHLFIGFTLLLISIFLGVSFISYLSTGQADQSVVEAYTNTNVKESGAEVQNSFGLIGAIAAHYFIFLWFGIAAILIPPFLFIVAYKIIWHRALLPITKSFNFVVFYLIWISMVMGYFLLSQEEITMWGFLSGGIGYELAVISQSLMGWGAILFLIFLFVVFNMFFFDITRIPAFSGVLPSFENMINQIKSLIPEKKPKTKTADISSVLDQIKKEVEDEDANKDESETWVVKKLPTKPAAKKEKADPEFTIDLPEFKEEEKPLSKEIEEKVFAPKEEKAVAPPQQEEPSSNEELEDLSFDVEQKEFEEEVTEEAINYDPTLDLPRYKFPNPSLLFEYPEKDVKVSKDELEQNKDRIIETLVNFKIGISSIKATIGPTVTLYEIVPEAGVKISKIKNLEDDIALSLAALGIRIIAPIPGKGTIGIEVPNKNREMVDARSVITTSKFMESKMDLPVVLGKTISNEVFVTDLAKMPHLLMAGATGQGKSVGLNIILTSLLYKKHPSQLKLVLVDPKKVELTLFNKVEKHFLAKLPDSDEPIITDTSKVVNTLNSLCIEMDNRYDLLKSAACRNLKEYNKKFTERKLNPNKGHRFLPYIVLVIDELADLMMTAGKEVETPIARLAQLARAIGIHLIVATQRPSVNVITGIIKANFPARLSFRVTSKIDSRTILDAGGADQLIGMGDMLLSMGSDMTRLQCAFVDTPEVEKICDYIGEQRGYDDAYLLPEYAGEEESGIGEVDLSDRDALFADAARLIVMHQQGSTSLIQRKMKLGYNRAGRLIDQLEAAGIVGPFEGSKAREVLIPDDHSLEQLLSEIEIKY
ncbi:DNA segregation ATPase FtsK/SpoIIIE, S-DNA-T family [Ekhidna lutea]|uniref:DNA segregation ATPase FtsK/SpoIIIE, S-DNA-T family n=1 Tax=Ekhidna lutea TaxID=447679 RepID=A0A239JZ63_EKHLU|nr:DNA translocase FtsK [Ekhidna lutea]SNT10768.1 DNA segregation ATPase FtsK/SpoIIIE, S-DNA-T family [Ekhidna lutea]